MTIATNSPLEIISGDTVQWTRNFTDYPASSSWVLTYVLINSTHKISITAAASGADHLVTLAAAVTAAYNAGTYDWQAYVTKTTERYKVDSGIIVVKPNFATATTYDARSHAKKVLDAIEAVIEGRATVDQEEYTIGNRSLRRTPLEDLMKFRKQYQAEYSILLNQEKIANGIALRNRIKVKL